MGMGRLITSTPEMAQKVPISFPRMLMLGFTKNTGYWLLYMITRPRGGIDVSVADCGHGDHDPVEGGGDGGVLSVRLLSLYEVAEGGEEEAGDADEENEQAELLVTVLQGEGNRL